MQLLVAPHATALEAVEPPEEARSFHRALSSAIDDASDEVEDVANDLATGELTPERLYFYAFGSLDIRRDWRASAETPPPEVDRALRRARC